MRADAEQLFRVSRNLVRNARQAIIATGNAGEISICGTEDDTRGHQDHRHRPRFAAKAQEHLFQPFREASAKGATGLGPCIAQI